MNFRSKITTQDNGADAAREIIEGLSSGLLAADVDLILVFISGHAPETFRDLGRRLESTYPGAVVLGCTAEGVIGEGQELERTRAISAIAASLPNVAVKAFHLRQEDLEPDDEGGEVTWMSDLPILKDEDPKILAFGDPFSVDVRAFLNGIDSAFPGAPVIGGMASQGRRPGQNLLLVGGQFHDEGIVGVILTGAVAIETVVSQGCKPIGQPFVVTKGEKNVVRQLKNVTALEALRGVAAELEPTDLELLREQVFLGRAIDEYKSSFKRGDFLIQSVIGADPDSGAIAVGGDVKVGTTVQFHVRDGSTADEDLRQLVGPKTALEPKGALLFSCNGRGTNMWETPGHDVSILRDQNAALPVAGFFCAGELGPVGGRNFIHGFTASIALFYAPLT